MRLRLAVLTVLLSLVPAAARAATIRVNTTSSTIGVDGLCSLPEAVTAAGGGSTGGDCSPGDNPGSDDIALPAGTIDVTLLALTDVRLLGQGAATTVLDGGGAGTVLATQNTVELRDLTVTHGQAASHSLGLPGDDGGGIFEASGSLTIVSCVISDNVAGHGGQGSNQTGTGDFGGSGGNGGGIFVEPGATLSVVSSTISGNRAGAGGAGGVGTGGSTGTGGGGGAGGWGGAIYVDSGAQATIDRSTIANNHAGDGGPGGKGTGDTGGVGGAGGFGGAGGGVASNGGKLTVVASTLSGNVAGDAGDGGEGDGAALTTASGTGGAGGVGGGAGAIIFTGSSAPLSAVTNATLAGNAAGAGGDGGRGLGGNDGMGGHGSNVPGAGGAGGSAGAIAILQAPVGMLHDTLVGNQLGAQGLDYGATTGGGDGRGPGIVYSAGVVASTLAKSIAGGCSGDALGDLGFNLGRDGCPGSAADPQLGPLKDNGGPTQTMRPAAGSPAVDAVPSNLGCTAADQRGVPRPVGVACDIGAVELAAPTVTTGDYSGLTVNGTADGHGLSTKVSFEYGATTNYGSTLTAATVNSPGVTALSVTLPPMEPGTYHYRLVATNTDGTSVGADHPLTVVQTVQPPPSRAPVISKLSFKPKRLKRGHKATVRFTITEPASVKLSFARRKGKRYKAAGSLTRRVRAGAVKLTFKRRALKAGRYRLTLVATDASGRRSKPVRATFRVVAA